MSRSGSLLYTTGIGLASELVWVTRAGVATPVDATWTGEFSSPALSPDGTRLAVAIQGPESRDIWVTQLERHSKQRLTLDGGRNDYPTWTPDGIGHVSVRSGVGRRSICGRSGATGVGSRCSSSTKNGRSLKRCGLRMAHGSSTEHRPTSRARETSWGDGRTGK